jgi:ComF family protein
VPFARYLSSLFPQSCLLCGTASSAALCASCAADLPQLAERAPYLCPRCALPLSAPAPACGDCQRQPPAYDLTLAALHYAFPVDRLVQLLKFGGQRSFHRLASADFFARCLLARHSPVADVMVPVPLAPGRLRERGFNQALEIARPLARALHLPLDTCRLQRVRETTPQSLLPWRARQANLRQAFACRGDFAGQRVLVIDDVMTSGATLQAVAQTLKAYGAVHVCNWVVARAVRHEGSGPAADSQAAT